MSVNGVHCIYLIVLTCLLCSSADDPHDLGNIHHCGQGREKQGDCCHLCISEWEAPKRDQMGNQVERRSQILGDSQPERDGDSVEQIRGCTEPRDPQAEADMRCDVPGRKIHRQRGAERAV